MGGEREGWGEKEFERLGWNWNQSRKKKREKKMMGRKGVVDRWV